MATRSVATVFGGSGFIGRYVVKRLARQGHVVRVAVRDPEAALFLKPMGAVGQIVPLLRAAHQRRAPSRARSRAPTWWSTSSASWPKRRPRRLPPHPWPRAPAASPASRPPPASARLVQLSAIGADPASPSGYARSKAAGEAAVLAAFPAATILRPSIVFGAGGPVLQPLRRHGAAAAVHAGDLPAPRKFQPVYVGDVADAVMAALARAGRGRRASTNSAARRC